jgi:hypothetical protein
MLKIFKHNGRGHYLGSYIIVVAKDIDQATEIIRLKLIDLGLPNELPLVFEYEIEEGMFIHIDDGDY